MVTPFRAILVHAANRGMIPFAPKIATPTVEKTNTPALRPDQVISLTRAATPHVKVMFPFAVGTVARPAEYLDLDWPDVDLRGEQVTLRTKGGGTRRDTMPPIVIRALESLPHRVGAVFQTEDSKRYRDTDRQSGGQFKAAWAGACRRAGLPGEVRVYARKDRKKGPSYERFAPEHTPYVLRHTWAWWHYRQHKDLILLQLDGGWESQDMLQVYVKLMSEAYRDEILAFLNGEVGLHFGAPAVDNRFRAIAVQSGRKTPLGRPKRSANA